MIQDVNILSPVSEAEHNVNPCPASISSCQESFDGLKGQDPGPTEGNGTFVIAMGAFGEKGNEETTKDRNISVSRSSCCKQKPCKSGCPGHSI